MSHEMTRQDMIDSFSDFHKDAYGFRPRWGYNTLTLDELKEQFDTFAEQCERNAIEDDLREKEGIRAFKKLLAEVMGMCSCDVKTAVRYLMDAEDDPYAHDGDYFNFLYDLPYGYVQDAA